MFIRLAPLATFFVLLSGCASAPVGMAQSTPENILLTVENREFGDLRVVVAADGMSPYGVGMVSGLETRTFKVPRAVFSVEGVRIIASPRNDAERFVSPILMVDGGQTVNWRVDRTSRGTSVLIR